MVDTVKLLVRINDPLKLDGSRFSPISLQQLVNSKPGSRTYLNPSPIYAKTGKYMPSLTMFKRFNKNGPVYQLAVEFSAPKMIYGNNFDELVEEDFDKLLAAIQEKLFELIGLRLFKQQIAQSDVGSWHPSKNVVFLDHTSSLTVLNTISKLDISRVYDLQNTDFRPGHVVHIHCNSLDIAFYDKLADLNKAKTSPKRAIEKDSLIQLNLLDELTSYRPLEIFRYEVRFVGRASIKRAFPELERWTFETLFSKSLCRNVLIKHWEKITASVDMLALDAKRPLELLQNYLTEFPEASPQTALAAVTCVMISGSEGVSSLRSTLESSFGTQVWYRIRKIIKVPGENRFMSFVHIDETLDRFEPTHMYKFIENVYNNVN